MKDQEHTSSRLKLRSFCNFYGWLATLLTIHLHMCILPLKRTNLYNVLIPLYIRTDFILIVISDVDLIHIAFLIHSALVQPCCVYTLMTYSVVLVLVCIDFFYLEG